jgi:hypothetical protein
MYAISCCGLVYVADFAEQTGSCRLIARLDSDTLIKLKLQLTATRAVLDATGD